MDTDLIEIVLGLLCVVAAVLGIGAFLYNLIFRASKWNYPNVARGAGIGILGGILLGIAGVSEVYQTAEWTGIMQVVGGLLVVVGLVWMLFSDSSH